MIPFVALLAALLAAGCGKKGPPLAPLVRIPAAVDQIAARPIGHDVYVTLTIPAANVDEYAPADVDRVEVFGYTGRSAPPRGRWPELGELVATVPVAPPPDAAARAPANETGAPAQGAQVTIVDTLTGDELVQGKLPPVPRTAAAGAAADPSPGAAGLPALKRFYTAIPFSPRGRPGPPGAVAEFVLGLLPDAPPAVSVSYTENAMSVSWDPSGGLVGFLLERPLPEEPLPLELEEQLAASPRPVAPAAAPAGPVLYNVYRVSVDDPFAPPADRAASAWAKEPPAPLNAAPLAAFTWTDPVVFNQPRCYTVRAVRGAGADARIGPSSPAACVTPVDTFAPAPPEGLATVASEGVISLIWQPNTEADLGGYLVLRGIAGGDTLLPLTPTPISEARYRDAEVAPGTRYVYAVVAVDNRFPVPNLSAPSAAAEETAR